MIRFECCIAKISGLRLLKCVLRCHKCVIGEVWGGFEVVKGGLVCFGVVWGVSTVPQFISRIKYEKKLNCHEDNLAFYYICNIRI